MDERYPIGKYEHLEFSDEQKEQWLADIRFLPNAIEAAISNLNEDQLHTPYRDGGWTVHQLVHHVADSHMNAYIRFKLAYTEAEPIIKTYEEKLWAETADVKKLPVNISVTLLYALHARWHEFLASFTRDDYNKIIVHPDWGKQTLWFLLGMYAWHSRHHVAHINQLRQKKSWN